MLLVASTILLVAVCSAQTSSPPKRHIILLKAPETSSASSPFTTSQAILHQNLHSLRQKFSTFSTFADSSPDITELSDSGIFLFEGLDDKSVQWWKSQKGVASVEEDVMVKIAMVKQTEEEMARKAGLMKVMQTEGDIGGALARPRSVVNGTMVIEMDPPNWGIDRIDQREFPLNQEFIYSYPASGQNVRIYIIDTGININHVDYKGRAIHGVNFVEGESDEDENGHGSFVTGLAIGSTFGVSKNATAIAVKVNKLSCLNSNGEGRASDVMKGVNWILQNHKPGQRAVANLSIGANYLKALNDLVQKAMDAGIVFVAAAGNEDQPACRTSPASTKGVITVSSTGINDRFSPFANWGSCVSLLAPGEDLKSAWHTSPIATHIASGTSFSSPLVAGIVANYLSGLREVRRGVVEKVYDVVVNQESTKHVVKGFLVLTPNKVAFSRVDQWDALKRQEGGGNGTGGEELQFESGAWMSKVGGLSWTLKGWIILVVALVWVLSW
ncbi:hypothetical protein HDV05_002515 [Chytridiales sp. JEL 0842]|nr:hypothetical protein HDV05_002515 [Chytridiales sp. JEL 0842]